MRIMTSNLVNPILEMCTDDRVIMNRLQNTNGDLMNRIKYLEDIVLYNKRKGKDGKSKKVVITENSDDDLNEREKVLDANEGRTVFDEIVDRIINAEISYKQRLLDVKNSHDNHLTTVEDRLFSQETNIRSCLSV
jgi:hypothetical protein